MAALPLDEWNPRTIISKSHRIYILGPSFNLPIHTSGLTSNIVWIKKNKHMMVTKRQHIT